MDALPPPDDRPETSVFGRRRLPRGNPHLWADRLEDWFARLTNHVKIIYFLLALCLIHLVADTFHALYDLR